MLALLAALSGLLGPSIAVAPQDWADTGGDRRLVSPSGGRYVVLKQAGVDAVTFEYCERSAGAAPMTAAAEEPWLLAAPKSVERDPDDRVVARGRFDQLPTDVLVPDRLTGFAMFDSANIAGRGHAVVWFGVDGGQRFALALGEIFGGADTGALYSSIGRWWRRGCWLDDDGAAVIVVALSGEVREIAIADGAVRTPDARRLAQLAARGPANGRELALELIAERFAGAAKVALPTAIVIYHDRAEALSLRLRAGVLLHLAGLLTPADELLAVARAGDQPDAVRHYAIRHLPVVLRGNAIPVLQQLLRDAAEPWCSSCFAAFGRVGEPAVPVLLEMLQDRDRPSGHRAGAANALREIRSPRAFGPLFDAALGDDDHVAEAALRAAIATGHPDLLPRLIALLARGSIHDCSIAIHLTEHPDRAALPALEAALARATPATGQTWLRWARDACSR